MKKIIILFTMFSFFTASASDKPKKVPSNEPAEILIGQSADLSGSMKLYSNTIRTGILAYIAHANENGGINGKKLKLVSVDDKGSPLKTKENIAGLLKNQKIEMFLGCTGTRGILQTLPMIESGKISMFFPWGGDPKLYNPNLKNIVNGPGLLQPQLTEIANYIAKTLMFKKVALFYADSDFNINAAKKLDAELLKLDIIPVAKESYNRYTFDIQKATNSLKEADPKVIVCLTTSTPVVRIISNLLEEGHYGTIFIGIDSTLFAKEMLKDRGVNFNFTSAVPDPETSKIGIAIEYLEAMQKHFPEETYNVLSFTYFIAASIIGEAMKKVSGKLTGQKVIEQIELMQSYDLGGFKVNFDPADRHAFGKQVSMIRG